MSRSVLSTANDGAAVFQDKNSFGLSVKNWRMDWRKVNSLQKLLQLVGNTKTFSRAFTKISALCSLSRFCHLAAKKVKVCWCVKFQRILTFRKTVMPCYKSNTTISRQRIVLKLKHEHHHCFEASFARFYALTTHCMFCMVRHWFVCGASVKHGDVR